jgi:anti-anti-sigma factor
MSKSVVPFAEGPLHVEREVTAHAVVVTVSGEVDHETVGALHLELDIAWALAAPRAPVVVDLTGVTFFGSAGLHELLLQHRRAEEHRMQLRVVAAHRTVLRPMEITELQHVLHLFADRQAALQAGCTRRTGWAARTERPGTHVEQP